MKGVKLPPPQKKLPSKTPALLALMVREIVKYCSRPKFEDNLEIYLHNSANKSFFQRNFKERFSDI